MPCKDEPSDIARGAVEPYIDADLYEYEYRRRRDDVYFYTRLANTQLAPGANILELCCGTGRVMRSLLRAGYSVTGVDLSRQMLAGARRGVLRLPRSMRPNAAFAQGDLRTLDLERTFPLVICPFNSLEHMYTDDDVLRGLLTAHRHMEADGLFALDVEVPDLQWLLRDSDRRWARTRFRHPSTRQLLEYSTNHTWDAQTEIVTCRFFYEPLEPGPLDDTQIIELTQRKFDPDHLRELAHDAGLETLSHDADFQDVPVDDSAVTQVLICRRSGSSRRL